MSRVTILTAVVLATLTDLAKAQLQVAQLQPFKVLEVCVPFNTLVTPSPTNSFDILVDADLAVKQSLRAGVDTSGALSIAATGDFSSNNSIKITVRAPSTVLRGVTTSSAVGAEVVVDGGFVSTDNFTIINNGATTLYVVNLTAPNVVVRNPGAGEFLLRGAFEKVALANTGAGTAYISGVTQTVDLSLGGVGNVYVDAANDNVVIRGQTGMASLANVAYNRGQCEVTSQVSAIFGSPCQLNNVPIPTRAVLWSCGITLNGTFGCQGGTGTFAGRGGASSGSLNSAVTSSTGLGSMSSSSSTTGGSGYSQTTTSSGGTTTTSSSTGGRTTTTINGMQVDAAPAQCSAAAQEAVMAKI